MKVKWNRNFTEASPLFPFGYFLTICFIFHFLFLISLKQLREIELKMVSPILSSFGWFADFAKKPYHYSTVILTGHSLLFPILSMRSEKEPVLPTVRFLIAHALITSACPVTCFVIRNVDMQSKLASIRPTQSSKYLTNRQANLCCRNRQTFPSMIFCSVRDEREPLLATVPFLIVHAQLCFSFPVSVVKNKNQNGLGHDFV